MVADAADGNLLSRVTDVPGAREPPVASRPVSQAPDETAPAEDG